MSPIRMGTCSWKFDSWVGLVYSKAKGIDPLAEYAQRYDTVEVDQWFWSLFGDKVALPKDEVVRSYAAAVPEGFRFTIKAPNSLTLTHHYQKGKTAPLRANDHFLSVPLFEDFISTLAPIRPQIGSIMFQFEYLNRQKMPSQRVFQQRFGAFREQLDPSLPLGLEIRNPSYLNDDFFSFLEAEEVHPVLLQGYWMPPVQQVITRFGRWIEKHEILVVRLHGGDRAEIEERTQGQWNRIIESRQQELFEIAPLLRALDERNALVYVNVNNHYEGSAPLTIEVLKKLLGRTT